MNKKITIKNSKGEIKYCVLDGNRDLVQQLNEWYFGGRKSDLGVSFSTYEISVVDYISWDTMASFDIMSIEDTDMEVAWEWKDVTEA